MTPTTDAPEQVPGPAEPPRRRRIVVATGDPIGPRMAGPGIRASEIARALSREHDVRLVTTNDYQAVDDAVPAERVGAQRLRELEQWCEIFVFQGYLLRAYPFLRTSDKVLVADLYDPFHLEVLEQTRHRPDADRWKLSRDTVEVLNEQLARGDLFLCASAKQRDFWLGQLAAVGRINPATYDADPNLSSLLKVVPFGTSAGSPQHTRPVLRGVVPGIGASDLVILWGGGIYDWFDPLTLLEAVARLRNRLPQVRLYFLGTAHPNPDVPQMRMAVETRRRADELGLTGTHVFFNDTWVDYDDRANFLVEADIGVSTHFDHVETEFSFRTRILDYFWAQLPVIATGGDALADRIEHEGLGLTVPPEDPIALEEALHTMLADPDVTRRCREALAAHADTYAWPTVLAPLLEFCRTAERAPDSTHPAIRHTVLGPSRATRIVRGLLHRLRSWAHTRARR